MALARAFAVALTGVRGDIVEVEADISAGLPAFVLIGLPDAALGESRKRVSAAAVNAGSPLTQRKLTVNLSPASLRKQGSGFDLAIAIAALAAAGDVPAESASRAVHLGELGLDGRLRPVPGVLPAVLAARDAGFRRVLVPTANSAEAELVDGVDVVAVAGLRAAAIAHGAELDPIDLDPVEGPALDVAEPEEPDLADVAGNDEAVDALVAAAAGGHHVAMVGPPGAGKTMLARRLPSLLPDLTGAEALESTSIRSLAGLGIGGGLVRRPPFEAPHHTASAVSLVGGGSGRIVPGAIVRATNGVLFLDEAAEFPPSVLDALRQPLESGAVSIHRASGAATFPARFQLVLASNPCPCGRYGSADEECTCTPIARRRYLARMSGPLLDRVDIHLTVRRLGLAALRSGADGEHAARTSAVLRERVEAARQVARSRLAGTGWRRNADVAGTWLRAGARRIGPAAIGPLDRALERGAITMRGYDRALRLAWTLADLDGAAGPSADHIGRALFLRRGIGA
ncbi:YifB family Mg chelatase-like AAA ATPase [Leifsonia aquatica]|uniref:YifB family Mg chelatase-like AAA ATPase n=1 Tax=Leifsonia aquatica TaxID=144185 RepID=UPI003851052B